MKLLIILLIALVVIIPSSLDAFAQVVETTGQNYDLIEDFTIGKANWNAHAERIMNGQWSNYALTNTDEKVIFNTNSVGSLIFDKSSCSYSIWENGYTGTNIIPSVSAVATYLNNGQWQNLPINNEACDVSVSQYNDGVYLTSTKVLTQDITEDVFIPISAELFNSDPTFSEFTFVTRNATDTGYYNGETITTTGIVIDKFVQELRLDITKGYKETFKVWHTGEEELGISQTVHTPPTIEIANQVIDIQALNGQSFDRAYIEDNEAEILQLTDSVNYDFSTGIKSLTSANIIFEDNTYKLNLDYSSGFDDGISEQVAFIGYLEIDPTFTLTTGSTISGSKLNTSYDGVDNTCAGSANTKGSPTAHTLYVPALTNNGGECSRFTEYWDLSSLPDTIIVTDSFIEYDVITSTTPRNCQIYSIEESPISGYTNTEAYTDPEDGTSYVSSFSECNGTQTNTVQDLGTSADADIASTVAGDDEFGLGFSFINYLNTASISHLAFANIELQIEYTIPTAPQPPTSLSTATGIPLVTSWTAPTDIGNSALTNYKVFRTGSVSSQMELPNNSGSNADLTFTDNEFLLHSNIPVADNSTNWIPISTGVESLNIDKGLLMYFDMETSANVCSSTSSTDCVDPSTTVGGTIEAGGIFSDSQNDPYNNGVISSATSMDFNADWSSCVWVYGSAGASSLYMANWNAHVNTQDFLTSQYRTGAHSIFGSGLASSISITVASTPLTNTWQHVCVTWDDDGLIEYWIDAVSKGTDDASTSTLEVGGRPMLGGYWNSGGLGNSCGYGGSCDFDDWAYWNRILSDAEIGYLYNSRTGVEVMVGDYPSTSTTTYTSANTATGTIGTALVNPSLEFTNTNLPDNTDVLSVGAWVKLSPLCTPFCGDLNILSSEVASYSISSFESEGSELEMIESQNILYIIGDQNNFILRFDCTDAKTATGCSYVSESAVMTGVNPFGFEIDNLGTTFWHVDSSGDDVYSHTTTTPWCITDACTTENVASLALSSGSHPTGFEWNSDYTKFTTYDSVARTLDVYDCTGAKDITTCTQNASYASAVLHGITTDNGTPKWANSDTSFFYVNGNDDNMHRYDCSTAFRPSTCSESVTYPDHDLSSDGSRPSNMAISDDGQYVLVHEHTSDTINSYTMLAPETNTKLLGINNAVFNIDTTTASVTGSDGNIISVTGLTDNTSAPQHYSFTRDGSNGWIIYQNGVSRVTNTTSTSLGSNSGQNYSTNLTGTLDEFFINSDLLSASEIDNIFDRGETLTPLSTISSSGTTYSDSAVVGGTTYYYSVQAVNAIGSSDYITPFVSGLAGTPPNPPTGITASIPNTATAPLAVTVSFSPSATVGTGTVTGFQLLRDGVAVTTGGLVTSLTDTAPAGGTTYAYTVKALGTHGNSVASASSSVTTPNTPAQVTGLTVTPVSTSRIDLSWNTPSDNNSLISGYKVQISSNGGSSWSDVLTGNVNTVYQSLSLATNSQYHYKVSAINGVGTGTASAISNTYTMTPTPASLSATAVSEVQINLSWGASTGATGYKVEYESPNGDGFTTHTANTGNTDLTKSITSLTTGTQYNFRVSGINAGGASVASPEASSYTWGILQAPVLDTITRLTSTSLKLDFTTGAGLPVATGYLIERQTGAGWIELIADTASTSLTFTDTVLSSDQTATYRLYAINNIGTSPVSNERTSDAIASSGGGGGSSNKAVSSQTGITGLIDLTFIDQIHRVILGEFLSKSINVAWDSSENIEVKSIIVSDSPFRIVFQDVPFVLIGDPSGISNGKINYSVQIPNDLCNTQGQINCVEQRQYDIPVEIQTVHKSSTLTKSSVIKIDLAGGSDIPLVFVLLAIGAVPLAFIIRKVGSGKSKRKASGSSHKSSKNGSNSKKMSL